jgi:hypothetical protein
LSQKRAPSGHSGKLQPGLLNTLWTIFRGAAYGLFRR